MAEIELFSASAASEDRRGETAAQMYNLGNVSLRSPMPQGRAAPLAGYGQILPE